MSASNLALLLSDASATDALGAALARAVLDGGLRSAVVYFQGELGAGKTTCVRSLLRALGVEGAIRSPTYTLVEAYAAAGLPCIHVDLYRLGSPAAVEELGLRDYLAGDCVMLVEWPERGGAALPPADLEVRLTYRGDARGAQVLRHTAHGGVLLEMLRHDTRLASYVSNLT